MEDPFYFVSYIHASAAKMLHMNETPPILVLCRDLLFASKISSAAKGLNVPAKLIREPQKLAEETSAKRLIVDLTQEGFIDAAADWKQATAGHVTGFAGHADVTTINRASEAGIDRVLSRGEFVARLAEVLTDNA
jgi:hypothetical protein